MRKMLLKKIWESLISVLPIAALVIILAFTIVDIEVGIIGLFAAGAVLLILGMGLFTLGADVAMMPMGSSVGSFMSRTKKRHLPWLILACLVIGVFITIAEPDLQVLAEQLNPGVGANQLVLWSVAIGVGLFLVVAIIRTFFKIKLKYLLLVLYAIVFVLAIFVPSNFLAVSFDSGGVTTGPITVPFLMALGIGLATVRNSKSNSEDSFGLIALCSIGPILAIMILGISGQSEVGISENVVPVIHNFSDIAKAFGNGLLHYGKEVALALLPIIIIFFLFQFIFLRLPKSQIIRIIIGILYTFVGLTIFLAGVNVGFMPMGKLMGEKIAEAAFNWVLIPIGMVMGCFIVMAEPAVHVLNKQVEEITGGAIPKKAMMIALCSGIAIAVGLAMVRVLTGVSIWYFILPVYGIALALMFIVPPVFTGIAFDSGGVASGPMTATFLLPFAMGACMILGGEEKVFMDAFGLVAFVAMIPLLTVQIVGLIFKLKTKRREVLLKASLGAHDEDIIDFDADEQEETTEAGSVAVIIDDAPAGEDHTGMPQGAALPETDHTDTGAAHSGDTSSDTETADAEEL